MENIKVDKVVICKQGKESENFKRFKEIVKRKKIQVMVVKKRRRIKYREKFKNSDFMANG